MKSNSNKIKILLHGDDYHTQTFYEQLKDFGVEIFEPEYFDELTPAIDYKKFKLFHLISSTLPVISKLKKYNKPILNHWIGTDVYRFINDSYIRRFLKKRIINSKNVTNLTVSENLKEELKHFGVDSLLMPLTKLKFVNEIPPLPEKFSVLAYVPEKRWNFYNGDLILKLAKLMPDIEFHILAAGTKKIKQSNIFTYDFIDEISLFYKKCSALIRVTVHDGLAKMVLEALSYGRHVLWSEPFPHCYEVHNLAECVNVLIELKKNRTANPEGKIFVENSFNTEKIIGEYLNLCRKKTGIK